MRNSDCGVGRRKTSPVHQDVSVRRYLGSLISLSAAASRDDRQERFPGRHRASHTHSQTTTSVSAPTLENSQYPVDRSIDLANGAEPLLAPRPGQILAEVLDLVNVVGPESNRERKRGHQRGSTALKWSGDDVQRQLRSLSAPFCWALSISAAGVSRFQRLPARSGDYLGQETPAPGK